ncbi:MAG: APC family permease, partial [Chitinophagaceae bacterium]
MAQQEFKPTLGLMDATMIVAGSMIGSGIFIVSADITRNVGSSGWLMAVWLITGFMTVTAAVSYGELSGMYPKAGGQYVYLKEAYSPLFGFLYGWSFFAVIQTATIAAVGVAFSKFLAYLVPAVSEDLVALDLDFLRITPAQLVSIALIVLLTFVNTRGVKEGKYIQTTFTIAKLVSLFGLIVFGFVMLKPEIWQQNWENPWQLQSMSKEGDTISYALVPALGAIAAAMVGSIFSSDAWN